MFYICEKLGLEHVLYTIPQNNEEIEDFEFIKKILMHNTNYFMNLTDNEIRKYIFLNRLNAYDIVSAVNYAYPIRTCDKKIKI